MWVFTRSSRTGRRGRGDILGRYLHITTRLRRVLLVGTLVTTSVLVSAHVASAASTMVGEHFVAGSPFPGSTFSITSSVCNSSGVSQFTFEATGTTEGRDVNNNPMAAPVPGTFTESGTVTFNGTGGLATSVSITFAVEGSGGPLVSGTKTLQQGYNVASCTPGSSPPLIGWIGDTAYTANFTGGGTETGHAAMSAGTVSPEGTFDPGPPVLGGGMIENFFPPYPAQSVSGTVTDQNGAAFPTGSAGVGACPGATPSPSCPGIVYASADSSGAYSFTGLPPGQWTLGGFAFVGGNVLLSTTVTITLAPGQNITGVNFTIYVPTPLTGGATFVIGDRNSAVGSQVTFWGSQWAKANSLSGGTAPSTFKGFANSNSNPPACGAGWTSAPGNSSNPPATVPAYMAVIVTSAASSSRSSISGNTTRIVIVKTDAGYTDNPGHAGTGTVVGEVLCGG
jgi:hypothetical protein